jgi:hypothetical protein
MSREVPEALGRLAHDRAVSGLADQSRAVGQLPDLQRLTDFARPLVDQQIRKHEETVPVLPAKKPVTNDGWDTRGQDAKPGEDKALLGRGIAGEGRTVVRRPVGWKERQKRQRPTSLEDALLRKRLALLSKFPEWSDKLLKAGHDGECQAMKSGSPLERTDWGRRKTVINDYMMRVVEQSNAVFGDYRNPKAKPSPIIVMAASRKDETK